MLAGVPADWCAVSWIVAGSRDSSGSDCSKLGEEGKWRQELSLDSCCTALVSAEVANTREQPAQALL